MDRLQAMTAFVRVVENGSFSGAARQLGVGQPAISKIIAHFEMRLQVSLLLRSTHGLSPTDAGRRFYERALAAIEHADEADLAARDAGKGLSGRLRLSAATTFARLHIIPSLPRFLDDNPELEIDVVLDDRNIDLVAEGVDLSLRLGTLSDSSVIARRLATGERSVIAAPAYLAKAGKPCGPADLAAHEAVIYSQQPSVWSFIGHGTEISVALHGKVRMSAAEGQRAGVLAGLGLTVASDWMFAPELADGSVRRVLEDWRLPPIDLWAIYPAGRMATAKARRFAGFVESTMAAHSDRRDGSVRPGRSGPYPRA